jgi:hypothetical protein
MCQSFTATALKPRAYNVTHLTDLMDHPQAHRGDVQRRERHGVQTTPWPKLPGATNTQPLCWPRTPKIQSRLQYCKAPWRRVTF